MTAHVDFVGLLYIVWGALTTLIGLSMLSLGIGAAAIISSASRMGGAQVAASLTAAVFTTLAIIAVIWGAAHIVVGIPLRRLRPGARLPALVLGAVDVLLLPYGTALGCYAMWTLLSEGGKKAFQS